MNTSWLVVAAILLAFGILIATVRKTLGNFSRKALLEKLSPENRKRFEAFFERQDEYEACLRVLEQVARLGLVGSMAFAIMPPAAGGGPPVSPLFGSHRTALLYFVLLLAGLVVVGLELVPAVLARVSPERFMISAVPLVEPLYWICKIPLKIYQTLVNALVRTLGAQSAVEPAVLVEQEILSAVEEGEREGILHKSEISMIESIIKFRDREVSKVLTPRTDMVALEASTPLSECVGAVIECGHSRIPIYRENKDNIVGILYVKDLLRYWSRSEDSRVVLEDLLRKANFVPETKKISELFQEFKTQRFHIAIVLDEFGGVAGLITIEDIIEEILGEIEEESEGEGDENRLVRVRDGVFEMDARLPIQVLNRELDLMTQAPIPEGDGFETVGGFLFSSMGRIPKAGESYQHGAARFVVLEASERSIERIRVELGGKEREDG
ncbi:MAG: HlyC/CorC family transporter [Planctomycetes bacterium]|nr:HlyC/CorC family transporter [Planctomycetota bacterium]